LEHQAQQAELGDMSPSQIATPTLNASQWESMRDFILCPKNV
jgi:hypothetical protein